jgi:hypothetical protein
MSTPLSDPDNVLWIPVEEDGFTDDEVQLIVNGGALAVTAAANDFDESKHKRDNRGRFAESNGGKKQYTELQRSKVKSIFTKHNTRWAQDPRKIYDTALEVSKTHSDLTMSDALDIMDDTLQRTDRPFRTRVEEFLQTSEGKKHVAAKGGSAPDDATSQTLPATPTQKPEVSPPSKSVTPRPAEAPKAEPASTPVPTTTTPTPKYKNKTELKASLDGAVLDHASAAALQRSMNKATPPPLSASQKKALNAYSEGQFQSINSCLRGNQSQPCTPALNKTISQIKAAMKPSTSDVQLYRSVNHWAFGVNTPNDLHNLVGKTFTDKGVVSTSINELKWSGNVDVYIEAPKGTKMVWLQPYSEHPTEDEMALAPDQNFEVVSVTSFGQFTNPKVVLRVVPGSDEK